MSKVHEIRQKSPPPVLNCIICGLTQIKIGALRDWMPVSGGYLCSKTACRDAASAPRFVPPDERPF